MSQNPQKFLVIRLSSIGDIVHALPAVAALGNTFPDAEITWAVETRYACLLQNNPYLKQVISLDTLGWRCSLNQVATFREIIQTAQALRHEPFDAVIDFQGLVKTGFIAWMCRSPRRVGFAKYQHREPGSGFFYTDEVPVPVGRHVIEENLALVEWLGARAGAWQFPLPQHPEDNLYVESALENRKIKDFILINPGGGWITKRWPPANYSILLQKLDAELPWSTVMSGSPAEEKEILEIIQRSGSQRAHYIPTTLRQFLALGRRARLFVGGDTGPLHIAGALGVPIVALHGPTDPRRNGPFSPADIALSNRGPINHTRKARNPKFLDGISVAEVLEAICERLARSCGT